MTNGFYSTVIEDFEQQSVAPEYQDFQARLKEMSQKFNACVAAVKETGDQDFHDICARHLYEMAADIIMCHLLLQNASLAPELFGKSLQVYLNYAEAEVEKHATWVTRMSAGQLENYRIG